MKKPENRFRRDLRRRPIWRRNAALGAIMADMDAHIGQMLKGVCSFDPVGTFVASLAHHVVAPKIAKMIAADLLEAMRQQSLANSRPAKASPISFGKTDTSSVRREGMLTERVQ